MTTTALDKKNCKDCGFNLKEIFLYDFYVNLNSLLDLELAFGYDRDDLSFQKISHLVKYVNTNPVTQEIHTQHVCPTFRSGCPRQETRSAG